jgi:hypothetical protein
MKKTHLIILVMLFFPIYAAFGQNIKDTEASPLLKTNWHQKGLYAKYSPDNEMIGCWSTSFAQIFYYHNLFPKGQIDYTISKGDNIKLNIDTVSYSSRKFPETLNEKTTQNLINDVAIYGFCVATIIQKNFGVGNYVLPMSTVNTLLETHFDCKVNYYEYNQIEFEAQYDSIVTLVQDEIDSKQPLLYYVESSKRKFGHAMVIDGYKFKKNHFFIHLNMGWNERSNGWYRFDKRVFLQYNDKECRVLVTVKPS